MSMSDLHGVRWMNKIEISLPERYELVAGDTFELFYRGIVKVRNIENHYMCVDCDIGQAFSRRYTVTPTEDNIGEHRLTVKVLDDFGEVIGEGETVLRVCMPASEPEKRVNVLIVGDSLTAGGIWADELCRRVTGTDGEGFGGSAPEGLGLRNIKFIGKKTSAKSGAGFEGFGGWTFGNYLLTSNSGTAYWVYVDSHTKTEADQEAVYSDALGNEWQLETLEEKRLLFKKHGGTGLLPTSGILKLKNGGTDRADIMYNGTDLDSVNPFCYNGRVDFSAYLADIGEDKIDYAYILLGWNNSLTPREEYMRNARKFLDMLYEFAPGCRVALMGIQMPSVDGMGTSYGAKAHWSYRNIQGWVFELNDINMTLSREYREKGYFLDFINIAGQFDSDNNFPTVERRFNIRNAMTEMSQSNGVHPSPCGYLQIADAAFRHFNNNLKN